MAGVAAARDENEASRSGQDRPPPRLVPFVPSGTLGADARFVRAKENSPTEAMYRRIVS